MGGLLESRSSGLRCTMPIGCRINMVTSRGGGTTRLPKEDWTGPGWNGNRSKLCWWVVGLCLWIATALQPGQQRDPVSYQKKEQAFGQKIPIQFFISQRVIFKIRKTASKVQGRFWKVGWKNLKARGVRCHSLLRTSPHCCTLNPAAVEIAGARPAQYWACHCPVMGGKEPRT